MRHWGALLQRHRRARQHNSPRSMVFRYLLNRVDCIIVFFLLLCIQHSSCHDVKGISWGLKCLRAAVQLSALWLVGR